MSRGASFKFNLKQLPWLLSGDFFFKKHHTAETFKRVTSKMLKITADILTRAARESARESVCWSRRTPGVSMNEEYNRAALSASVLEGIFVS